MKTLEATGSKADCVREMETFVKAEVTSDRARYLHFIMVVEHLASAFLGEDKYNVKLVIDLDAGWLTFQAQGVE